MMDVGTVGEERIVAFAHTSDKHTHYIEARHDKRRHGYNERVAVESFEIERRGCKQMQAQE